jgi:hypothetical protein
MGAELFCQEPNRLGVSMKRIALAAAAAALLLATILPDASLAHTFAARTNLTIHKVPVGATDAGATIVVYGRLRSGRATCRSNKVVKLMKVRPGPDRVLGRDRTDSEGEYLFVRKPFSDQTVYTRFSGTLQTSYGHSHRCRHSRSDNLFINVG